MNVPCSGTHLVEPGRLHTPLVDRSADDGIEPDVGQLGSVIDPRLGAVFLLDDTRGAIGEPFLHAALEHVRGLHDVIVGRDNRVLSIGPGRLRQEGDRPGSALACRGPLRIGQEVLDRQHGVLLCWRWAT